MRSLPIRGGVPGLFNAPTQSLSAYATSTSCALSCSTWTPTRSFSSLRPPATPSTLLFRSSDRSLTRAMALITCSPLYLQARHRSYHFYVNLENPEDTQRHVEEDLERLAEENKHDTTAYLHSLLNLSLSYYQAKDFVKAREIAEYTHQRALQHNAKSSLIYLTATTCSRCAGALAEEYEQHVAYMEEQAAVSVSLAPKPSVVFSAQRAIRKLKEDALRYDGIAQRTYQRPDLAFMRGGAGGRAQKHGQRPRADQRRHWQEDGNNVDEEYQDTYGERWQARRTRPEHTEVKRQCQRAQSPTSKYKVPK